MNSWVAFLTVVTLNVNGLGDKDKWSEVWHGLPLTDVLCSQETHLYTYLEFAFELYAQWYDFYYSHSTSASAGVCTAVKCLPGRWVVKAGEIPGRLLALDVFGEGDQVQIINVYTPNDVKTRLDFFSQMKTFF